MDSDQSRTIVAFDPGLTTGIAVLTPNNKIRIYEINVPYSEYQCKAKHLYSVWEYLFNLQPITGIVYEDFTYQHRTTVELFPVQVIGVLELYARIANVPIFSETASAAKKFWTDTKIKALGEWVPGMPHGMDALRHLLYHLALRNKEQEWILKLHETDQV